MDKNNFWLITLCALLIISDYTGLNLYLRIAIGANAVLILGEIILQIRRFLHRRKEEKD